MQATAKREAPNASVMLSVSMRGMLRCCAAVEVYLSDKMITIATKEY
jgi:hypothetical protein